MYLTKCLLQDNKASSFIHNKNSAFFNSAYSINAFYNFSIFNFDSNLGPVDSKNLIPISSTNFNFVQVNKETLDKKIEHQYKSVLDWENLKECSLIFKSTNNNFFLTFVDSFGHIIWKHSSGSLGLKGSQRTSIVALERLFDSFFLFLSRESFCTSNTLEDDTITLRNIYIRTSDINLVNFILDYYNENYIKFCKFMFQIHDVRIPHGYMRFKKVRRL